MEVPQELKQLYRHWNKHAQLEPTNLQGSSIDQSLLVAIENFTTERMRIWEKRQRGGGPPYTADPILQNYRFCNIYRELDRQTIEIHQDLVNIRDDFPLWLLNLMFHRFVCRPDTVKSVGHLDFDERNNKEVMQRLLDLPSPKYGTAYVFPISVIQRSEYPTREKFFCLYLPKVAKDVAEIISEFESETVLSALDELLPVFGFNFRFHWTEILIDIAYQFPGRINLHHDFYIGPGALPTLQRLGNGAEANDVLNDLVSVKLPDFSFLTYEGKKIPLSAENWEGICCEFRKYSNLQQAKGRKRRFGSSVRKSPHLV